MAFASCHIRCCQFNGERRCSVVARILAISCAYHGHILRLHGYNRPLSIVNDHHHILSPAHCLWVPSWCHYTVFLLTPWPIRPSWVLYYIAREELTVTSAAELWKFRSPESNYHRRHDIYHMSLYILCIVVVWDHVVDFCPPWDPAGRTRDSISI